MKNKKSLLLVLLLLVSLACSLTGTPTPETSAPLESVAPTFTPIPSFTPEAQTASAALSSGLTVQSSPVEEAGLNRPTPSKPKSLTCKVLMMRVSKALMRISSGLFKMK